MDEKLSDELVAALAELHDVVEDLVGADIVEPRACQESGLTRAMRWTEKVLAKVNRPSRMEREALEALAALMSSEGGEPRDGDPESAALWRRCRVLVARLKGGAR